MNNKNLTYKILPQIDSNICSQYPNYNYGKSKTLLLQSNSDNISRVLIKFDKTDLPSSSLNTSSGLKAILSIFNRYLDSTVRIPKINLLFYAINYEWTEGYGSILGLNGNVSWLYTKDGGLQWNGGYLTLKLMDYEINNESIDQLNINKYDIQADITDIINKQITTNTASHGILIKLSDQILQSQSVTLSYYSRLTYTVYPPNITIYKNSTALFVPATGSQETLFNSLVFNGLLTNLNFSLRGLKRTYNQNDIVKFNILAVLKYRTKQFNTLFTNIKNRILKTVYYSLIDNYTLLTILLCRPTTKLSYDMNGNYFYFNMRAINLIKRYYRFIFKILLLDGQLLIVDNKTQSFKVE